MLLPKKILLLPFFLLFLVAFGQNATNSETQDTLLLENIHLHLNKTTFFKGENLWFKAYVQDQLKGVPASTTNLHVGIFSKDGKLLHKKMFLLSEGIGLGDFKIDSTFTSESYTLMAWTNYMKNFEAATPFLQNIQILGNSETSQSASNTALTVLLYPEGQQYLADAFNNVALLVHDQDMRPVETGNIELYTEDGTLVQSKIQTNELGQGRFNFFADQDRTYLLKIKDPDGRLITKKLDNKSINSIGIGLRNEGNDAVILIPKAPASSLESIAGKKYTLAIYHKGKVSFSQDYVFGGDPAAISINRSYLPTGLNSAVIFDDKMQPLSQRVFYNSGGLSKKVHPVAVRYRLTDGKDSLKLSFRLPSGQAPASLSLSVLPADTRANKPSNSISSSFLVQPYLSKQLQNGGYFFEGKKRSKAYQLDTRLLMEESLSYDYDYGQINSQIKPYKIEEYIAFKGKITDANTEKEKQVSVYSQSLGNIDLLALSSNKDFNGNIPLFEGDSLSVSVLDGKGKLRLPKVKLYFDQDRDRFFDYSKWLGKSNQFNQEPLPINVVDKLDLSDGVILLDEAVVTAKPKAPKEFQITAEIQGRIIDSEALRKYGTFVNYIRRLGFQTRSNDREGGMGIFVFDAPDLYPVAVTIEGMRVNPDEIMSLPLTHIKTMVYNRRVYAHQGPFIALTVRHDMDDLYGRGKFEKLPIPKGFSRTQPYFTPAYPNYDSSLYKQYGAVWWEGQVRAEAEVFTTITVPLNGQEEVMVMVEGMSAQGLLYQAKQICNPFLYSEED